MMTSEVKKDSNVTCTESDAPKTKIGAYVEYIILFIVAITFQAAFVLLPGGFFFFVLGNGKMPTIIESIPYVLLFALSYISPVLFKDSFGERLQHIRSFDKKK